MAELSSPPFRSPVGLLRNPQGTVVGQVFIAEAPWTRWFEGVYARLGSFSAFSNAELTIQIGAVQAGITETGDELAALQIEVGGVKTTVADLGLELDVLTAQVNALPAVGAMPLAPRRPTQAVTLSSQTSAVVVRQYTLLAGMTTTLEAGSILRIL